MAGFAFRQIAVVEVQVTNRGAVVEGGMLWTRASSGQQSASSVGIELGNVLANDLSWLAFQSPDGATQSVQNSDLQLLTHRFRKLLIRGTHGESASRSTAVMVWFLSFPIQI